jgi:glycosyltransferase involved in cell wall biosynthesis
MSNLAGISSEVTANGVEVFHINVQGRLGGVHRLWKIGQKLRAIDPDVYIGCGTGVNVVLPPIIFIRRAKLVFFEAMSGVPNGTFDPRRIAAVAFDEVIAQAGPVASNFRRCFNYSKPIETLPAFSEPLEQTRGPVGLECGSKPIRAAMFGRLVPHKRGYWLVQQWARLQHTLDELHFFGSGAELPLIGKWVQDQRLGDRVFCHGDYPNGRAFAELMASFDLTLLPTVGAEGAPLVLLESMACGVPFVACNVGGIADYKNKDCIICEPQSDFIAAVEELVGKIKNGEIDRERLRDFFDGDFSNTVLARKWNAWLGRLVA